MVTARLPKDQSTQNSKGATPFCFTFFNHEKQVVDDWGGEPEKNIEIISSNVMRYRDSLHEQEIQRDLYRILTVAIV